MLTIADKRSIIEDHQNSAPVQTVTLARALGLEVYHVKGWNDDLSGLIRRDPDKGGKSGFAIFVNGDHHRNRRRFTTAHEIAHFVLHEDQIGDGIVDDVLYRSTLSSRQEAEANRLAADILMPWDLLNAEIDRGTTDVRKLARMFEVSQSAMAIRLGVPAETTQG